MQAETVPLSLKRRDHFVQIGVGTNVSDSESLHKVVKAIRSANNKLSQELLRGIESGLDELGAESRGLCIRRLT